MADGRYMDYINAVYIYDGKDTWTDESGSGMEQSCKVVEEKRQIMKQLINTEVEE